MTDVGAGRYTGTSPRNQPKSRSWVVGSTEARPGFMTTEFWMSLLGAIGVVIAAYISDTFDNDLGWILATSLFATYNLSRGLAKAGSREGPFAGSFGDRSDDQR
jgi:hypothetical protein